MNAHQVTRDFEKAVAEYTGAPYCVAVNSCTNALLLALKWYRLHMTDRSYVRIPNRTYISVPQSAKHASFDVHFVHEEWKGNYRLWPTKVWDSARRFTSGMYRKGQMQCLSFHHSKILGDTQGGAILHDNAEADVWFRKARFDGRTEGVHPKDDRFDMIGYHCMMSPDVAARLLLKLSTLPLHNEDLPCSEYPDLSKVEAFNG